jgi:hypothetical protein
VKGHAQVKEQEQEQEQEQDRRRASRILRDFRRPALVERWFARLTNDALRRGSHLDVCELRDAIDRYIAETNDDPRPFVWTKTADEIIASVARFCARTLDEAGPLVSADSGH